MYEQGYLIVLLLWKAHDAYSHVFQIMILYDFKNKTLLLE